MIIADNKTKRYFVPSLKVSPCFQANIEQHGQAQAYLALRVYAGQLGLQGPNPQDLLVSLGLHEDGALSFGGPLFRNGDDDDTDDDTDDDDSGMSFDSNNVDVKEEDDDDRDNDDDDVDIVYELINCD